MPIDGPRGTLSPFTIYPPLGPQGVVSARSLSDADAYIPAARLSPGTLTLPPPDPLPDRGQPVLGNLTTQVVQRTQRYVWPPVGVGEGYLSGLGQRVKGMDVVNGFARTLGKTKTIAQKGRMAQGSKNLGNFHPADALGPSAGKVFDRMG